MNLIHIAGHLGADPEVRYTPSGKKVTNLRVATRTRRTQSEETIWWRVTIWGEQFDKMIPYLKKGSPVMVAGELHKPEIFNDREGKPQVSMEITAVHLQFSPFGKPGGASSGGGQAESASPSQQGPAAPFGVMQEGAPTSPYAPPFAAAPNKAGAGETFDDEVPF